MRNDRNLKCKKPCGELKANLYVNLTKNSSLIYSKLKNRLILRFQSSFGVCISFAHRSKPNDEHKPNLAR
nr:hypothetical protein [uncultured Campylobacter sp.]